MELTSSTVERKADEAHQTVNTATIRAIDKAAPAIDRVAQAAHQTVDKVAAAAGPAADWINRSAEQLMRQQQQAAENARGYVRERPLVAVGIALAAGFLIGRLVR